MDSLEPMLMSQLKSPGVEEHQPNDRSHKLAPGRTTFLIMQKLPMQPEPTLGHDGGAGSGLDTLGHDGGGDSGLDSLLSSAYDVPVAQARLVREPDGNTQTTGKLTSGSRAYIMRRGYQFQVTSYLCVKPSVRVDRAA